MSDMGLDEYIRNLEKRIEKLETRELVRVSSWNVGTGSAAPLGDLHVDSDIRVAGDIWAQTNLDIGEDATIGGDLDVGGTVFVDQDVVVNDDLNVSGTAVILGDIYTVDFSDYSASSTIVGWTSYTTKQISYKKVGNLMFVRYWISGTSDNQETSFTLPFTSISGVRWGFKPSRARNDSTWLQGTAHGHIVGSSNKAWFFIDESTTSATSWVASGVKLIFGEFWYELA